MYILQYLLTHFTPCTICFQYSKKNHTLVRVPAYGKKYE